ncbi:MAG: alpha/beta hydrolase [Novosphingobium sp.]
MIWLAVPLLLLGVLTTVPNVPRSMPGALIPVYFMISLTGQLFALPGLILGVVLAALAEGTAAWLFAVTAALFGWAHMRNRLVGRLLLDAVGLTEQRIPLLAGLVPPAVGESRVRRIRNIAYGDAGERNLLDVVLPKTLPDRPMPVLLHIHGGAWVLGSKGSQARPLINHLVPQGWMAVDINYRLGPASRFPAMIIDVLRAIAWVKAHAHEHGGDPRRIAITGGSAGGHLSALAALAHDEPAFKPGFEDVDCSVAAAIPIYGRYDLLDRKFHMKAMHRLAVDKFMSEKVFPGTPEAHPELWQGTSPIDRIRADAPPMLVLHGTGDTMLPYRDARDFTKTLRAVSRQPVTLIELPEVEHAYDMASSALTWAHVRAMEAFLAPLTVPGAQPEDLGEDRLGRERVVAAEEG